MNNSPSKTSDRLVSLDVFRGITIAGMVLCQQSGNLADLLATRTCRVGWLDADRSSLSVFVFIVASLFRSRLDVGSKAAAASATSI